MMNGASISSKVSTALPYVQAIVLHRTLPSKVVLEVVEAVPARAYVSGSMEFALCNEEDKLLEQMEAVPLDIPLVLGAELNVGQAGERCRVGGCPTKGPYGGNCALAGRGRADRHYPV